MAKIVGSETGASSEVFSMNNVTDMSQIPQGIWRKLQGLGLGIKKGELPSKSGGGIYLGRVPRELSALHPDVAKVLRECDGQPMAKFA